jgi:hypothetical protein
LHIWPEFIIHMKLVRHLKVKRFMECVVMVIVLGVI